MLHQTPGVTFVKHHPKPYQEWSRYLDSLRMSIRMSIRMNIRMSIRMSINCGGWHTMLDGIPTEEASHEVRSGLEHPRADRNSQIKPKNGSAWHFHMMNFDSAPDISPDTDS